MSDQFTINAFLNDKFTELTKKYPECFPSGNFQGDIKWGFEVSLGKAELIFHPIKLAHFPPEIQNEIVAIFRLASPLE